MFKYKITDPKTGRSTVVAFRSQPTEEDLREAVERVFGKAEEDDGFYTSWGNLVKAGFKKGALDLWAMGISRPASKLAKVFGDEEEAENLELKAQALSEAGSEIAQEAAEKSPYGNIMTKVWLGVGGMAPALGSAALTKDPTKALGVASGVTGVQTAGSENKRLLDVETKRLMEEEGISEYEARIKASGSVLLPSLAQGAKTAGITYGGGIFAGKLGLASIETGAAASKASSSGMFGKAADFFAKKGAAPATAKYASTFALEGVEEGLDSLASSGIDWGTGYADSDLTLGEAVKRAQEDFIVGFITGGLIETARRGASAALGEGKKGEAAKKAPDELGIRELQLSKPENYEAYKKNISDQVKLASEEYGKAGLPKIGKILERSAANWVRDSLGDSNISDEAALGSKLGEVEKVRRLRELDLRLAEASDTGGMLESAVSKDQRNQVISAIQSEKAQIESGQKVMHEPAVQDVLDRLGVDTVAAAYDIMTGKAEAPVKPAEPKLPEPEAPEAKDQPIEAEEPAPESKKSDVLRETFEVPATKLKTERQAKVARRADEPFVDRPQTPFEQAQTSEDVLSPDIPPKQAELSGIDIGAGLTQQEAAAVRAGAQGRGPTMSAEQMMARRSGEKKTREAEERAKGVETAYQTPDKEVIISEVSDSVDITTSDPESATMDAIQEADSIAESSNIKLTAEDKIEIANRVQSRKEAEVAESGGVTVEQGLEAFASALDKLRGGLRKSRRGRLGANIGLVESQIELAASTGILAARAGLSATDVMNVALANLRTNLKKEGKRITDARSEEVLRRVSNYIVGRAEDAGTRSDFRNINLDIRAARKSRKLKAALKEAGINPDVLEGNVPLNADPRVTFKSNPLGNIKGEWNNTSEASAVLRHIDQDFTRVTSPSSTLDSANFLNKNQAPLVQKWASEKPDTGTQLSGRIDIPAFLSFGKYVVSITKGQTALGYDNILTLDVKADEKGLSVKSSGKGNVEDIASGQMAKDTIVYVTGGYMPSTFSPDSGVQTEDGRNVTPEELHDPRKYVQISMNPRRSKYFYDRRTGRAVKGFKAGTRIHQIGATLFAERGKDNIVYTERASDIGLVRLKRLQREFSKYARSGRAKMGSLNIDVMTATMADKMLGVAIDGIIVGRMTFDAALDYAYNKLDGVTQRSLDEDTVKSALAERLKLAIDALAMGQTEKASIEFAINALKMTSQLDVKYAEATEGLVKAAKVEKSRLDEVDIKSDIASAAPLLSGGGRLTKKLLQSLLNSPTKTLELGMNYLSSRLSLQINTEAQLRGSYHLRDENGKVIEDFSETISSEVDIYLRAKKSGRPLPMISPEAKRIADEIERVFDKQGEDAKAVQTFQRQKDGTYELGKFAMREKGYYQTLKIEYIEALRALLSGQRLDSAQESDLKVFIEKQNLKGRAEAKDWAKRNGLGESKSNIDGVGTETVSSLERARDTQLNLDLVDFTPQRFSLQSDAWAKRVSEIQAFRQGVPNDPDIFETYMKTLSEGEFSDVQGAKELSQIIDEARRTAYQEVNTKNLANELASTKEARFFNRLTSVIQMSALTSTLTQLTSIPFTFVKSARMGSKKSFLKAILSMTKDLKGTDEVRGMGLVTGSMRAMSGHYLDKSSISSAARNIFDKGGDLMLSPVAATDRLSRKISLHQAYHYVQEVKKAKQEGVEPKLIETFSKHAERLGLDPEAILNGDEVQESRYLIGSVFETQGSYKLGQLPVFMTNPAAQFALKFSPFAFQISNTIHTEVMTTYRERGIGASISYLMMLAATMAGSQELLSLLFEKFFGRERTDIATLDEIAAQETALGAGKLAFDRVTQDLLDVGVFGATGYFIQGNKFADGDFSIGDFANASVFKEIAEVSEQYRDGKIDSDEVLRKLGRGLFKYYRDTSSLLAQNESIRQDYDSLVRIDKERKKRKLRGVLERWQEDTGVEIARGYGEPTSTTKYKRYVADALLIGDIAEARLRAIEFSEASSDKEKSWSALSQSLSARQPIMSAGRMSNEQIQSFSEWASRNLSKEDLDEIAEVNREYEQSGFRAGLMTRGGETPYKDSMNQMKELMTGKPTKKSKPMPPRRRTTYEDLLRQRKADIGGG